MILRWAGSKAKQLTHIYDILGCDKKRLIEPFCGTAIVSLRALCFEEYLINDANPDLINFYKNLDTLKPPTDMTKEEFLIERDNFNEKGRKGVRAAQRFWNLNRNCHRGLMNYGSNGRLITSFGACSAPATNVREYREFFNKKTVTITCKDYKKVIRKSNENDVIYIDPPYYDSTSRYNSEYFGPDQQTELVLEVEEAVKRGSKVVISNYDLPFTRFLYRTADLIVDPIGSSQNLKKGKKELIAVWK